MSDVRSDDLTLFQTRHEWARANARSVLVDGVQWSVYELDTGPQEREVELMLLFESHGVVRRHVPIYPDDWRTVPAEQLVAFGTQH
jgi:hypothetical protein